MAVTSGGTQVLLRRETVDDLLALVRSRFSVDFIAAVLRHLVAENISIRPLVRILEMRESARILRQVLDTLPGGPVINRESEGALKTVLPQKEKVLTNMEALIHQFMVATDSINAPVGEVWFSAENPKGELGFFLRSDGGLKADRLRIRGPSFANLQVLGEVLPGHMVADVMAVLGSLDFVMGECDR